ncbi:Lrp/AsnC family transcriptional regulator [Natrialbaceae archaeon GCM10025896]
MTPARITLLRVLVCAGPRRRSGRARATESGAFARPTYRYRQPFATAARIEGMTVDLDDLDRRILDRLQDDARNNTATDIAAEVDVTANTVRNRIRNLEESGIVAGYVPLIDYERTEKSLHVLVECSVPVPDRGDLARTALSVDGVVAVRELMTGRRNVRIELVAEETDEITAAVNRLQERGLVVEEENLVKAAHLQPFDHFGTV